MSKGGKVLHLYMEVRSVAEDDGRVSGGGDLMLQCTDVLPHSQSPNRSSAPSPVTQHYTGSEHRNSPSSKPSSRHSVSFQLQNPDATGSPTQYHRQDVLPDSFGQLLEVLAQGTVASDHCGSLNVDSHQGKMLMSPSSPSSRRLIVPSIPTCQRGSCEVEQLEDEEGMTSVVSFGYVKKSNVHHTARLRGSAGQHKREFIRMDGQLPSHLHKQLSDPVWYNTRLPPGDPQSSHCYLPQGSSPQSSPLQQGATLDAIARDATCRALEEFGSPELKRRFAGFSPENHSPTMLRHQQSSRCRSWGGSPVVPRTARTLPPKTQLLELDHSQYPSSVNGLPRSPASDHLSAHSNFSSSPHSLSQQRTWVGHDSPRLTSKFHSPLRAGRPTNIQHEAPAGSSTTGYSPRYSHCRGKSGDSTTIINTGPNVTDSAHHTPNVELNSSNQTRLRSSGCSSRASDVDILAGGWRSASPSLRPEVACKLAMDAIMMSSVFADRCIPFPSPTQGESFRSDSPKSRESFSQESQPYATLHGCSSPEPPQTGSRKHSWKTDQPAPQTKPGHISPLLSRRGPPSPASPGLPARLHRAAAFHSPVLDTRQQQSFYAKDALTLHRYEPPQYIGDRKLPGGERKQHDRSPRDCPGLPWKLSHHFSEALPVSWTSRQQDWREAGQIQDRDEACQENPRSSPFRLYVPKSEADKGVRCSEYQGLVSDVSKDKREEAQDHSSATGTSSQSSSGVTGSLGDRNDSLSPETSSQSSHDTADGSGMQSDSSSVTSSSRSQKIARAKWEFLFGGQTQEQPGVTDTPPATPPTSGSPSPTAPSSLHLRSANHRRGWDSEGRKLSHHEVRQIEVELLTTNHRDSKPKTGIIRRTIKYSETDLDAVPLRCYRETDLDEVMRAEVEAAEEGDSAIWSNCSVVGNSRFSPDNTSPKPQAGTGRDINGKEEEDEEEEEEGVVSWASVRMQGDKQRQRAPKEEVEVLGLLLKGSPEASDNHGGLKSPISVGSPRRPSDSNLDSFSRHFESIMESHRAKGTSYSSLDSVDLLTSGSTSVFTFDLPTLTPEIQSQICESAKQIIELSFAPLARSDPAGPSHNSCSEISLCVGGPGTCRGGQDESSLPTCSRSEKETWRRPILKDGFRKASSVPSLHCSPRERSVNRPPELLYPQADVAQRLALSGSDEALANGRKPDLQAAKRLAKRLYSLDGFRKSDIARHLGKNNDFSQMVAGEYLSNFNFSGLNIDQALRLFLSQFALMGETQERERVLVHFSRRFTQCNPDWMNTEDSVHTLTCAVMLLNSDLHGNNIGKRMSCSQFISNLEGLNDGRDFPKDLLKTLYSSIKNEKLQWTIDEEELRKSMSELVDARTDSASHTIKRLGSSSGNPLVGVAQQADGELYKSGFLVRKVHAEPDGKRTPRGKRGWKTFYGLMKGLVLYLQKDEYRAERELTEEDVKSAVSVHHSLAMRAADYRKRPNVFYLRTADWRVFLFQAPNAEQMQSWITRINVVAAMFSAPPFPAAIGSQKRFSRPLLPGSNTKLSQEEQVKSHENRFRAVSSELTELVSTASPDKKVKGREQEDHKLRGEYLEFEKTRYGTYAMLLRAKLASGDDDLSAFELRLFDDGGLQRAHSSPVLPQDATAKEKVRGTKTSKSLRVTSSSSKSVGIEEGDKKKDVGSQRAELQKQSTKGNEAL